MVIHRAYPTKYRGCQMRSRLEAKWACVFDQLGWTWEYEPFDLAGWIPDFLITNAKIPFLVEVKPLRQRDEKLQAEIDKAIGRYSPEDEIAYAEHEYDCLIAGAVPFWDDADSDYCIGWLTDDYFGDWQNAVILQQLIPGVHGLACGMTGWYGDRMSGLADGDHFYALESAETVQKYWVNACNETQWKRPR